MVIVTGLPLLVQLSGIVDDRVMRMCPRFAVDNLPPSRTCLQYRHYRDASGKTVKSIVYNLHILVCIELN